MHLVSHNGGWFTPWTLQLRTSKLPCAIDGCWYESCLFSRTDSEVLERYESLIDAVGGHALYSMQFGLK